MGTLFEPTRKIWVFRAKARGLGSGEIFDEQGEKIGCQHRVTVNTGGKIEFTEVDGTKVCEIRQKIDAIEEIYEVKDDTGKSLGRIKRAMTSTKTTKLKLETDDNKKMFEAKGKSLSHYYVILDVSGNNVANVNKLDKRKEVVDKGKDIFKEKFELRIHDAYVGKVDARQLVGFVIAATGR